MKKMLQWSIFIFLLYSVFIVWYIYGVDTEIPSQYKGSQADPSVFMNERQIELSYEFSRIKHVLYFLTTPFEWLVLLAIMVIGISKKFRMWAERITKITFLQHVIYIFYYSVLTTIIMFPIQWISFIVSKHYGIATSSFQLWMKDKLLDFWFNYFLLAIAAYVLFYLIKKSKQRWWFYAWLLTVPFTLFLLFVKPVIIDPLYNDFYPLTDKQLEAQILEMASTANIPAEHVYEVNMSEKTNALNAYVTGIGSNSRIVLWDTTLQKLTDEEVLFIMAHEMAHYVKNHVMVGVAGYLLISLIGFYLTAKILTYLIARYHHLFNVKGLHDLAIFPLVLLIFSVLSFVSSPFSNAVSRYQEQTADQYAIELTNNPEAAITTFQNLTITGLSEVHPPAIVKWFRYGHPTMLERLVFIEEFRENKDVSSP